MKEWKGREIEKNQKIAEYSIYSKIKVFLTKEMK